MKKTLLPLLTIVFGLVLAFSACHRPEVEMTDGFVSDTLGALTNRWYIVDYPFYQDCDRGSYVELQKQALCHAYIQCNDEPHMDGTWSWDGKELWINCDIFAGLRGVTPRGKIKRIDQQTLQMVIRLPVLGNCTVTLSRINPVTGNPYNGED
ncbi:MAG: hypothetical protein J6Y77_02225 [Paludibacteraceae bacterium]|nr:hypothetical protein [Paludibacteraceae bacterium]